MLEIKILPINFKKVTNECAENNVLPITFEIVNDEYAENKNLAGYYFKSNRQDFYFQHIRRLLLK